MKPAAVATCITAPWTFRGHLVQPPKHMFLSFAILYLLIFASASVHSAVVLGIGLSLLLVNNEIILDRID